MKRLLDMRKAAPTAARRDTRNLTPFDDTSPQAAGLRRHLEAARFLVDHAPDYRSRREAQHTANGLRRALKPASVEAPDPRPAEVAHWVQLYRVVRCADRRGAGR